MRNAFLEDLPRWVDEGTSMVAGRGTPTVTYLTMRHMKLLGVGYGELSKAKMSTIQNLKAIIQLHAIAARHDELIKEFGEGAVTRETEVWMNYDIELDVAPFAPRQATPGRAPWCASRSSTRASAPTPSASIR